MADSFKGSDHIEINPGTSDTIIPIWLRFKPASASTKNDGAAPYGSTLHKCSVKAFSVEDNSSSTAILNSMTASVSTYDACLYLRYSTTLDEGMYYLRASVIHSLDGTTNVIQNKSYDLDRIMLKRI